MMSAIATLRHGAWKAGTENQKSVHRLHQIGI
jgi:hypothetical protein